jgi:hypothetical protein
VASSNFNITVLLVLMSDASIDKICILKFKNFTILSVTLNFDLGISCPHSKIVACTYNIKIIGFDVEKWIVIAEIEAFFQTINFWHFFIFPFIFSHISCQIVFWYAVFYEPDVTNFICNFILRKVGWTYI